MGLSIVPAAVTVTIAGVVYPLATVTSADDNLAPYVDTCEIRVPWGPRSIAGEETAPTETVPAYHAAVVVTDGTWTWRGLVTAVYRAASGTDRWLEIACRGLGVVLDKTYLPTFARQSVSGVVQVPGGPRFAPGTCSAAASGPDGTHYLVSNGGNWTVEKALRSYIANVNATCDLPPITLDIAGADLSRELTDSDLEVCSVHASIATILGHRMGLYWRPLITASGWVVQVRGYASAGIDVDLTTGRTTDYRVGGDASAALASLEVRAARLVYAMSIDGYVGGDLRPDWTADDVTARQGGDRSSPAYRRFRLQNFALPNGSSSLTADAVGNLPVAEDSELRAGAAPWLLFAQSATDGTWTSLQGRVSIQAGAGLVWIEGIEPSEWDSWSRIRLSLSLSPRSHLSATRTGGTGMGRGLVMVATQHAYAAGVSTRVSGSSLASVTGSVVETQDPIDDEADALWSTLSGPQDSGSWTINGGVIPVPGTRVAAFVLPVPGAPAERIAVTCLVTAVRRVWTALGLVAYVEAGILPYATGARVKA